MGFLRHTPQALTLANLFCGFASILLITSGQEKLGILLLFAGFIFDILDGLVARLFSWKSKLGGELDSLADEISFVIVPGIIIAVIFFQKSWIGIVAALASISFGTLRLARFNITKDKGYFQGMSVPYFTTIIIAVYIIFFMEKRFEINPYIFAPFLIAISSLQVSSVRFPSLKGPSFLKYKYRGMTLLVFFTAAIIAGMELKNVGLAFQATALLIILLPFLFDKNVIKKKYAYLFVVLFVLSCIASIIINYPPLIAGIPFLYAVIFSPLVQYSLEK
jgi:CDP-diacylglycerol--serine O-phosphatidyltransferase